MKTKKRAASVAGGKAKKVKVEVISDSESGSGSGSDEEEDEDDDEEDEDAEDAAGYADLRRLFAAASAPSPLRLENDNLNSENSLLKSQVQNLQRDQDTLQQVISALKNPVHVDVTVKVHAGKAFPTGELKLRVLQTGGTRNLRETAANTLRGAYGVDALSVSMRGANKSFWDFSMGGVDKDGILDVVQDSVWELRYSMQDGDRMQWAIGTTASGTIEYKSDKKLVNEYLPQIPPATKYKPPVFIPSANGSSSTTTSRSRSSSRR